MVAATLTLGAMAQTTPTKHEAKENAKTDVRKLRQDRADRNTAIAHGKLKTAHKEQKEIKNERKDLNANKKQLKNKGEALPVTKAKAKA